MSNHPIPRLALALQGVGSHGAFTWGVLDRLLQQPDFEIVGISGTSAGARQRHVSHIKKRNVLLISSSMMIAPG